MTSRTFAVVRHPHRGEPIVLSIAADDVELAVTLTPMRALQLAGELLAAGMRELGGLHQPEQGFVQAHECAESGEGRGATRPTSSPPSTERGVDYCYREDLPPAVRAERADKVREALSARQARFDELEAALDGAAG